MTREDVLREFGVYASRLSCNALADEIIRLRAALARMACPVCHEINPAEVHTCTPAPKVTVVDEWRLIDASGIHGATYNNETRARDKAVAWDMRYPDDAPHTVRRVALLDDPNHNDAPEAH